MRHLPNIITIARALAGPLGAFLLLISASAGQESEAIRYGLASAIIFVIAAASDWLDGWLARRLGVEGPLGALLDPIADKLLVGPYLIAYTAILGWEWFISAPVVIVLARDAAVTALRLGRGSGDKRLSVTFDAKMKTAIQMAVVAAPFGLYPALIAFDASPDTIADTTLYWVGTVWFLAVLSVWTALPYWRAAQTK
ncbi:CDP-alcohol phosphatidyltransferase family protein [Maricaulaceae bacterium MS644]